MNLHWENSGVAEPKSQDPIESLHAQVYPVCHEKSLWREIVAMRLAVSVLDAMRQGCLVTDKRLIYR